MFYSHTKFDNSETFGNTLCFTKEVHISRTKSISKLASIRRMVAGPFLKKTKASGSSIKYRTLARKKSTLFFKNVVNLGEVSLLKKISLTYYPEFDSNLSLNNITTQIESAILFGKKLKGFSMISRYFNFSVAKKYYAFFLKIYRNAVGRSVWSSLVEHFLSSLAYIRYVNDYNKLAGLEFVIDTESHKTMDDILCEKSYLLDEFYNEYYADASTSIEKPAEVSSESDTESEPGTESEYGTESDSRSETDSDSDSRTTKAKSVRVMNFELRSDFVFNRAVKGMVLGSDNLPTKSSTFFGLNLWNYTRVGISNPSTLDIANVLYSFFGKFLFRSYERSVNALGLLVGRTNNFGFFYKNSKDFFNQSWGNSGADLMLDIMKNEIYFSYTYRNFVNRRNTIEMDLYNIYNEALFCTYNNLACVENSKYSDSGLDLEDVKISPLFINWARAGYVILNDHDHLESRINHVSDTFKNFNINFDSKVFGHPFHLVNPSILPLTFSFVFFTFIQDILSSFCLEMWYVNSISILVHAAMIGLFFSVILS